MPSWGAFNSVVTFEAIPVQIVGLLPVHPHLVTRHALVYTAMKYFNNFLGQLSQTFLPIVCDEGVYDITKDIQMNLVT